MKKQEPDNDVLEALKLEMYAAFQWGRLTSGLGAREETKFDQWFDSGKKREKLAQLMELANSNLMLYKVLDALNGVLRTTNWSRIGSVELQVALDVVNELEGSDYKIVDRILKETNKQNDTRQD